MLKFFDYIYFSVKNKQNEEHSSNLFVQPQQKADYTVVLTIIANELTSAQSWKYTITMLI